VNGGLKRALKQHLLLRGSRDFESIEAYEAFVHQVMDRRNRGRQKRLTEEMAVMKALPVTSLAIYREEQVPVSSGGLIHVLRNTYSVPTGLIGHQVKVRVHEWHLEVHYGGELRETLPRLIGARKHHVDYHHLIGTLLRKPGAFRNYRYRDDLFPTLAFRRAWEQLGQWYTPRKADLTYLRVLHLAARGLESDVAAALELLLTAEESWTERDVEQLLELERPTVPAVDRGKVKLDIYDQLLQGVRCEPA
jgi:hypothetical protein